MVSPPSDNAKHDQMPLAAHASDPSDETLVVAHAQGGTNQNVFISGGPLSDAIDYQPTDGEWPAIGNPQFRPQVITRMRSSGENRVESETAPIADALGQKTTSAHVGYDKLFDLWDEVDAPWSERRTPLYSRGRPFLIYGRKEGAPPEKADTHTPLCWRPHAS